jgi:hypothetical protein
MRWMSVYSQLFHSVAQRIRMHTESLQFAGVQLHSLKFKKESGRSLMQSAEFNKGRFAFKLSFCPFKFAAQLNRLAIWPNERELHEVLVRINHGERHTLHQSAFRISGDVEKIELAGLSIR